MLEHNAVMSVAVAGKLLIYVAACLLLWIGQRLKMDWFRFDKAIGIVTVILALIPPVMGELVLWLLFLLLYYLPEKQGEPAVPVMAE